MQALGIQLPKLPELDKEDIKAVRSFLPGKLLTRTSTMLAVLAGLFVSAISANVGLRRLLGVTDLPLWVSAALIGACFLAVIAQVILEWRAKQNQAALQALAVKPGAEQTGYFRIGPYLDTAEDRAKFSRPDRAAERKCWSG